LAIEFCVQPARLGILHALQKSIQTVVSTMTTPYFATRSRREEFRSPCQATRTSQTANAGLALGLD
jgi:hypothetical protein